MANSEKLICVVTGGNSGIGKETCMGIAERGHKIIIGCRDVELSNEVKKEILDAYSDASVEVMKLDLSSFASIEEFSNSLMQKYDRVDLLVNNAGVVVPEFRLTVDGLESHFGINHLGHFLLTKKLLPLLGKSKEARIVNVSSLAHTWGQSTFFSYLDKADMKLEGAQAREKFTEIVKSGFSRFFEYGKSKMANILFTNELAEKLKEKNMENVFCFSLHPGVIKTKLSREVDISTKEGAATTLHCCFNKEAIKYQGWYFSKCKQNKNFYENDRFKNYGKMLWDLSEKLIK